jgi:putative phosphoribosyl transferase
MKRETLASTDREVTLDIHGHVVQGFLHVPDGARGVVLFAHGSGSGRFSPRNQSVAGALHDARMATLLLDLLDEDEAEDREKVFDIELLADRLQSAAEWLGHHPQAAGLRLGLFGASTGAGAALVFASRSPDTVAAVVSRGGRPDLAMEYLHRVKAPTLLIVGGEDDVVIDLNRHALHALNCPKEMVIIPGATHLFPEPGALEEVARLAADWFGTHLPG